MSKRTVVSEAVRQRARAGEWVPGERMPGVADLCEVYGCSSATAVQAMRLLAEEGVLDRRQGAGYFYAGPGRDVPSGSELLAAVQEVRRSLDRLEQLARRMS